MSKIIRIFAPVFTHPKLRRKMKHAGCILEFTEHRNRELMLAYRKAISEQKHIDIREVSVIVVNSPCSRFWVSEERAAVVVSELLKGRPVLDTMRPLKREMFQEIFRRVQLLMPDHPNDTLFDIVMMAVNSPADKFYMRPRCAMGIIYKIKNGYYDNLKRYHR